MLELAYGDGVDERGTVMVVVMAPEATPADVEAIVGLVRSAGGEAFVSRGVTRTIVGLVGDVADAAGVPVELRRVDVKLVHG